MIDLEQLRYAVMDMILEDDWDRYDFDKILAGAESCWDDTAVRVNSSDFEFVFDNVSLDCLSVNVNDLIEEE